MRAPSQIRLPEVAGKFYPAEPNAALHMLQTCLNVTLDPAIANPKLLVLPHAGWNYCLPVMASGLRTLLAAKARFKRVVLIGPAHHASFKGIATPSHNSWKTLFGDVQVDVSSVNKLIQAKQIHVNNAAFTNEHALEVILPAVQKILGEILLVPLLVGEAAHVDIVKTLESLWGGAETLIIVSTDLSHFHTSGDALSLDTQTRINIETFGQNAITARDACGYRALNAALAVAEKHDLRLTALDVRHSGQMTQDNTQVVGYGAFVGEPASTARLAPQDRDHLVKVAYDSLKKASELQAMPHFVLDPLVKPSFAAMRASFVTLKLNGALRGCIGSLRPHRSLLLDVAMNAVKAGFSDGRFKALTPQELEEISIEVSILSHPRKISARNNMDLLAQLRPLHEGLMLHEGDKTSLFLPSVWESLPSPQAFVAALKEKAGLVPDYWSDTLTFHRFSTESFGAAPALKQEPALKQDMKQAA